MAKREPIEVEVGGTKYLVCGLPPRHCFHILRKLSPFLGHLAPILADVLGKKDEADEDAPKSPFEDAAETAEAEEATAPMDEMLSAGLSAVPVLTDVLADMSEKTADFVLDGLLAGAMIALDNGRGMPIVEGGRLKHVELELEAQLELAGRVFLFNFERFFNALPSAFKDKARSLQTRLAG